MRPSGGFLARPEFREILCAALVLAWRIRMHPISSIATDWVSILCVLWVGAILSRGRKPWPAVTVVTMTGLLALYASRQVPLTLSALGIGP